MRDPAHDQHQPTVLYNAMINPIVPYAIRGAIWYQGESITGGTQGLLLYGHVMDTLVTQWRRLWHQGDFPFYVVQLPGQQNVSNNPLVREQQARILSLPNTGMAVVLDTGEAKNVHPKNKEPLGENLSKIALANVYGRKIEFSGPVYASSKIEAARFASSSPTPRLEVERWQPAQVVPDRRRGPELRRCRRQNRRRLGRGQQSKVSAPLAVRYAWDNFPDTANLYNGAGLQAAPFRTDNWDAMPPSPRR